MPAETLYCFLSYSSFCFEDVFVHSVTFIPVVKTFYGFQIIFYLNVLKQICLSYR